MRVTCNNCGGQNLLQAASIMIDLLDFERYGQQDPILTWDDLIFEDYYFCKDCNGQVEVNEEQD